MEYWNLYNYEGKKQKKIAIRGSKLNNNDFHLVVNAWIINDKNEFLITQRAKNKSHPLMWECTGGSALIHETSLDAATREIKEELGININKDSATLIGRTRRYYENCPDILDVWLFKSNVSIDEITIQKEEVNDVMWASREKLLELFNNGKFEANALFNKVVNINFNPEIYYIGFNANNAICNENFLSGSITLNPNNEKGNIFYTKKYIKNKDDNFLKEYKNYLVTTMKKLHNKNNNTLFLAFNKKIKDLLKDVKGFNVISENYDVIDKLNDKKYTRELLNNKINVINTKWIDKKINYEEAKNMVNSSKFVIQGKIGAGGNNTYLIDTKEKFDRYSTLCSNNYFISKYINHLPINTTVIIGKYNDIYLPSSIQLIKLENDCFKYVGADFIYYQNLNAKIKKQINDYTTNIVKELKKLNYKGIVGIDYILDENDNLYFMEINPRFQASSFMISKYLDKYCSTSIAELHYLAITNQSIGNNYIDKINKSFVNCFNKDDFSNFKYSKILKNGYYSKNKTTCFRRIFNYSILKHGDFQKRDKDK